MSSTTRYRSNRRPVSVLATIALLSWGLTGCATGFRDRARTAEFSENYDQAIVEYTRALQERPGDRGLLQDLERARLASALQHYAQGRRQAGIGNDDEALFEFQIAAELNPDSAEIQEALRETRQRVQTRLITRAEGETELEALIERNSGLPPIGFELPADPLPESLVFRDASTRDVFSALGQFTGVNVIFDPGFVDDVVSIDLRGAALSTALTSVTQSTRNFYRITAPQTVTIVPDTPSKRREYPEEVVQTFYLSYADPEDTVNLLRQVVELRSLAAVSATRAIAVKDTPERVAATARLIAAIDKARPEVVIDVELLEVDRQRLRDYGLQFASPGSPGIDGFASIDESNLTLADLGNLTGADIFVANLPGLFYRLLKQDNDTRTLANPHLRTSAGLAATAEFGERVPIPVTRFTPLAAGGVAQQPVTSFNYENIGVNIEITPYTHHNDDVSLDLNISVTNVSGTGFGGVPIIGNRSITTTIRLRDGETNILAGLIRDHEREVMEGIPGLSDLPFIGRLFARNQRDIQETDIVLTLTPRIIRVLDLEDEDLRAFRLERDTGASLDILGRLPAPITPGAIQRIEPASDVPQRVDPIVSPIQPPPQ